ncbi:hypothetical protein F5Y03DRAFT_69475 [Xylaria venustula]|nr:hypothetical protein F5Y03DRAFT_69475 [Xylaria venustula]
MYGIIIVSLPLTTPATQPFDPRSTARTSTVPGVVHKHRPILQSTILSTRRLLSHASSDRDEDHQPDTQTRNTHNQAQALSFLPIPPLPQARCLPQPVFLLVLAPKLSNSSKTAGRCRRRRRRCRRRRPLPSRPKRAICPATWLDLHSSTRARRCCLVLSHPRTNEHHARPHPPTAPEPSSLRLLHFSPGRARCRSGTKQPILGCQLGSLPAALHCTVLLRSLWVPRILPS